MDQKELERLRVAFALYVTRKIINADDVVHPDEVAIVHKMFPPRQLERMGFLEAGGTRLTAEFEVAKKEAVEQLPKKLTEPEKEDFIAWFRQVCEADGIVDEREERIVARAKEILGLPR